MVLPTFDIIDDAHRLRQYFEQKLFGDPFARKNVAEALSETWIFFDENHLASARGFLNFVVEQSMNDLGLRPDTRANTALFYRIHENFIRFEVSVRKGQLCTFEDRNVRATCVDMYTNGDRMKPNAERAAMWSHS